MTQDSELANEWFKGKQGPGRPKGSRNKWTIAREEAARVARDNPGLTPQDYLLGLMRDEKLDREERSKYAIALLPHYCPRLQAIKVEDNRGVSIEYTPEQLYGELIRLLIQSGAVNEKLLKPVPALGIAVDAVIEEDD